MAKTNKVVDEGVQTDYTSVIVSYSNGIEYQTAGFLGIKPVLLRHPKGFLKLLLEERFMWPDMKHRWCTAYLKTGVTDKWIRANRQLLGSKCLFTSGERRDESR